jgi:hypothetical protein
MFFTTKSHPLFYHQGAKGTKERKAQNMAAILLSINKSRRDDM